MKIVEALATTRTGLTRKEVRQQTKIASGSQFTSYMKNLTQSGFIEEYTPYGSQASSRNRFRLVDFFTLFHLRWLKSNPSLSSWSKLAESQSFRSWAGFSFETLCWNHAGQILADVGLAKANVSLSKWSYQSSDPNEESAKIDLLADVAGAGTYLIEIKHYRLEFVLSKLEREKIERFRRVLAKQQKPKKSIFVLLLSSSGVKQNQHSDEIIDKIISSEVLFH